MRLAVVLVVLCLAAVASSKTLYERKSFPSTWAKLNRADKHESLTFIIALRQQNLDQLEKVFWEVSTPGSSNYRNFLTRDQILDIVAPTKADHDAVVAWLRSHDIESFKSFGDAIEVTCCVGVAEELFSTEFYAFKHRESGRILARQMGPYSIPTALDNIIDMVSGLSEFPVPVTPLKRRSATNGGFSVVPQTCMNVYSSPSSATITNSSQGVIEFEQQYYSPSELQAFAQQMDVTIPALSSDHVVGFNSPSSPGVEATLDIQYIAAIGRSVENWFWIEQGTTWLYGFSTHFFGTQEVPMVISISYGWSEADQCEDGIGAQECQQLGVDSFGYVARVNTEFQKIGLRGVSMLCASGDSGANGRTDGGCSKPKLFPSFPAASPFITAVGATQLQNAETNLQNPPPACSSGALPCASSGTEVAVSYDHAHFASGGGFSNVAATPDYQKSAVSNYLSSGVALPPSSYYNATGRGFPDVAALGSDILIDVQSLETVGGTSASSPIFAGVIALLNDHAIQKDGKPLGFLNSFLYKMASEHPAAFNDVTVGDNKCTEQGCGLFGQCKGFTAAKGWDPVTGLGSPNYKEMLNYLNSML